MAREIIQIINEVIQKYPKPKDNYIFILEYDKDKNMYRPKIIKGDGSIYSEGMWEKRGSSLGSFWLLKGADSLKDSLDIIEDTGKLDVKIEKAIREFCMNGNEQTTQEEAEFFKWCGVVERDPKIDIAGLRIAGMPREHTKRLIEKFPHLAENKKFVEDEEGNMLQVKEKKIIDIELPNDGKLISTFADELAQTIKHEKILFYRASTRKVVEIGRIKHSDGTNEYSGFLDLSPNRFITLIERYFKPWFIVYTKKGEDKKYRSLRQTDARIVLESDNFREEMPLINRIFNAQIPIIYDGKLTFPLMGYDERFSSWLAFDSPLITDTNMSLEEAKDIIYYMFKEFCFQSNQDYVNAIAGIITPFLKGLFPSFTTRTPLFIYEANRERAGKDYLAGLTGMLYEGKALEEPPISDGEYRSSGKNDELKKKILAALISGRKRLHFANNKGHLNNSVLEAIITSKEHSDRILGKSENVVLPNELDFSLSGNIGITLTPDLSNRSRFVKLFLDIEDANSRPFENPDLHGWVLNNRGKILSAFYSLVRTWIDKGKPKGSIPFTSFPEWAEVCGGILECTGIGNPCVKDKGLLGSSIDTETDEMKSLFELIHEVSPDKWLTKGEIKRLIENYGDDLFNYMNWDSRSDQTKFGVKLNKFVGRMLSDIKLVVYDSSIRPARWQYKFTKQFKITQKNEIFGKNVVTHGNHGNVCPAQQNMRTYIYNSNRGQEVTNVTNVANEDFNDLEEKYKQDGLI